MRRAGRALTCLRTLRTLAAALAIGIVVLPAAAEPDPPQGAAADTLDAISRFLQERGQAEAAAPGAPAAPLRTGLLERVHDRASSMVVAAMNFVGVGYRRGGNSAETGFDCSGFTRFVFDMGLGLVLPRRADEQASAPGLIEVGRNDLQPGDLVFFNTMKRTFSHVGIYIGDNRFIHSPRTGQQVRTEDMVSSYWAKRFTGARRAIAGQELPQHAVVAEPGPARH